MTVRGAWHFDVERCFEPARLANGDAAATRVRGVARGHTRCNPAVGMHIEHAALPPHFHTGYAVVLALLAAALVLRAAYRPRPHLFFRTALIGGALVAFAAQTLWVFHRGLDGAWTVLAAAGIVTLAIYGEVLRAMRAEQQR